MKDHILKNSFLFSVKRSIPILIGYFPVGMAFGILMSGVGYNFVWSFFSSIFVYAGSLQMLMVSFLSEGLPLVTVAITALLLNSRHIFYGLSFVEKFRAFGAWKYLLIYGMSDESYSLLCSYRKTKGVDEKWVHIFSTVLIFTYWAFFSALGGLVGQLLTFDTTGIDFALTALFVVILVEQLKGAASRLPAAVAAVSAVLCLLILGPDKFLLPSLLLTVAALIALRAPIEGREAIK